MSAVTPTSTDGWKNWPSIRSPPTTTSAPALDRVRDVPLDLLDRRLVDERPDVDALREPVRDLEPAHGLREAREEVVVDRRPGRASGSPRCTSARSCGTCTMIAPATASSRSASSKTMNGALPPSSSEIFLSPGAHCAMRSFPTSVEPVKPSLRTSGFDVISPPIARCVLGGARHDGEDAGRNARLLRERRDRERGERRLLGRLQHHRAAGRERRRRLARRHRRREVPGRDPRRHADRLLRDVDPLVRPRRRDRVAVDALRLLAEPLVERGGVRDLDARLRERLALLEHHEPREIVLVLEHEVGEPAQHASAILRRPRLPRGKRALGGGERASRLGRAHPRHLGDRPRRSRG